MTTPSTPAPLAREGRITNRQADVLLHASSNGRYVTNEPDVIAMGEEGLLLDYGPQYLAGGMHYLVTTPTGRKALSEWKRAQPIPKQPKRRKSRVFECWQRYEDACGRIEFSTFWKDIWPTYEFK